MTSRLMSSLGLRPRPEDFNAEVAGFFWVSDLGRLGLVNLVAADSVAFLELEVGICISPI